MVTFHYFGRVDHKSEVKLKTSGFVDNMSEIQFGRGIEYYNIS